ncbi:hypothetical protein QRX50_33945 [Amycolatopsis carbonis]|uniref:Uncharacterized protein n=1 Tax=Amycolatopsis carbonis TaxID=715471 RepID=A0A9Y2IDD7_9PSEU|nr:hypothetical protein [Amycolatopsis sp. 2-15]WIX76443.1 hypothetical protein QRX50_33945 [Amycolatopsis sp. 2-15]
MDLTVRYGPETDQLADVFFPRPLPHPSFSCCTVDPGGSTSTADTSNRRLGR